MGAVKAVGQLYGSPTASTNQYLAWDHYCICCSNSESGESNISGTNKIHRSTRTTRGRPVNMRSAAETFCCVQKPNKRTYEGQESIVFYSSFFVKHYCAKAKKSNPSSLELNRTPALQNGLKSGAHNPERSTAINSCNGVFTSDFIFR